MVGAVVAMNGCDEVGLDDCARELLAATPALASARLVGVEALAAWGSGRRFCRLRLDGAPVASVVLAVPPGGGLAPAVGRE